MRRSGSILRLIRRQASGAIPAGEYSFNTRDGLALRKTPNESIPVQRPLSRLVFSSLASFRRRPSRDPLLSGTIACSEPGPAIDACSERRRAGRR